MGLTCLVTVHGIGFQQPPQPAHDDVPAVPGYADGLHQRLHDDATGLGARLGDDPVRWADSNGRVRGPVYVASSWYGIREDGLRRLNQALVHPSDPPAEVAHVALVYSHLELPDAPRYGAALDTLARTALQFHHYARPTAALRTAALDLAALLRPPTAPRDAATLSLRPRQDLAAHPSSPSRVLHQLLHRSGAAPGAPTGAAGHLAVLRTLENDVASYVCRNDLRERVRTFVQQALTRLADRDDVDSIVLNTHSQGSVLGFDVLARSAPDKVRALITAGAPLRKYVDLFAWGNRVGHIGDLMDHGSQWINFYDPRDPVADRLAPPGEWRIGDPDPAPHAPTLFRIAAADQPFDHDHDCPVQDRKVDNLAHSQHTGLRAHNYWDNQQEVIPALTKAIVTAAAATTRSSSTGPPPA